MAWTVIWSHKLLFIDSWWNVCRVILWTNIAWWVLRAHASALSFLAVQSPSRLMEEYIPEAWWKRYSLSDLRIKNTKIIGFSTINTAIFMQDTPNIFYHYNMLSGKHCSYFVIFPNEINSWHRISFWALSSCLIPSQQDALSEKSANLI